MTRAGPARCLGLKDRGHLGRRRAADIAVYSDDADREAMFTTPVYVFKDGELIVRDGKVDQGRQRRHARRAPGLRPLASRSR